MRVGRPGRRSRPPTRFARWFMGPPMHRRPECPCTAQAVRALILQDHTAGTTPHPEQPRGQTSRIPERANEVMLDQAEAAGWSSHRPHQLPAHDGTRWLRRVDSITPPLPDLRSVREPGLSIARASHDRVRQGLRQPGACPVPDAACASCRPTPAPGDAGRRSRSPGSRRSPKGPTLFAPRRRRRRSPISWARSRCTFFVVADNTASASSTRTPSSTGASSRTRARIPSWTGRRASMRLASRRPTSAWAAESWAAVSTRSSSARTRSRPSASILAAVKPAGRPAPTLARLP